MDEARLALVSGPLDVEAVRRQVAGPGEGGHGAVVTFVGSVRGHNAGHRVTRLEYEAYEPLAIHAFERIADEVAARWPSVRLAIHHRVGSLQVGEASVVIAASSGHRAEAFAGCRYAIERIKQIAPIWKREYFDGGEVWVEGATADPEDHAAREEALRRACA
jgi:molybdopterin synthase catalytic subunit